MGRWVSFIALAVIAWATTAQTMAGPAEPPPATPRFPGIDVSRFQRVIEWAAVADEGIRFAFVQASRGSGSDCTTAPEECGIDGYYAANYVAAKAERLRVGAYHRAFVGGEGATGVKADARAEARLFAATVGDVVPGDLLPALDVESPLGGLNAYEVRLWMKTWLRSVARRLAVKPIIYTNASTWRAIGDPTWFALRGHLLWIANWDVEVPQVPADNWAGQSWRIWQHSSSGRIDGISGHVDLDWLRFGWNGVAQAR